VLRRRDWKQFAKLVSSTSSSSSFRLVIDAVVVVVVVVVIVVFVVVVVDTACTHERVANCDERGAHASRSPRLVGQWSIGHSVSGQ